MSEIEKINNDIVSSPEVEKEASDKFIQSFKEISKLNVSEKVDAIFNFESALMDLIPGSEQAARDLALNHHFCNGQYAREIFLPRGILATGRVHRFDHISTISKGKVAVISSTEGYQTYEAPCTFASKAGTKRIVLPIEDTYWTTFHITNTKNVDDLFDEITHNNQRFCKETIQLLEELR